MGKEDGFKIRDGSAIHFVTFAVVLWQKIFQYGEFADIVVDSLRYRIEKNEVRVYAWVIMPDHIHLVIQSPQGDLSAFLRNFKTFSAKTILARLKASENSKYTAMLKLFEFAGQANIRNKKYQFWQQDNHPIQCPYLDWTMQKIDYIHNNPVKAGLVELPADYRYSSSGDYLGKKGLLEITRYI